MRKNIPKEILIHHTGSTETDPRADTSDHTFEIVNNGHRYNPRVWLGEYSSLGFAIGYHYFIDKTGKVTQGRADSDEGAHCVGHNTTSIGICLAGNFDVTMPTKEQIEALKTLIEKKMKDLSIGIDKVYPHRKFASKSCFGKKLPDNWVNTILGEPVISTPQNMSQCTAERDIIVAKDKEIRSLRVLIDSLLDYLKIK